MPFESSQRSTPRTLTTTESTSITATFVAMSRKIRFMDLFSFGVLGGCFILKFQDRPRSFFGNGIRRRIGISRRDSGHYGRVDHAQALDPPHAQLVVDHGHRVVPHLAGADGVK